MPEISNIYTDILSGLQAAESEEEREWLVMQFSLNNLSQTVREAVWAAAVPFWFDADFLTAVLEKPLNKEDYQTLTCLSYVEVFPGRGYNVHERTRNLLLDKLWKEEPEKFKELSRRAAAYCAKQNQEDTGWRVQTLFHKLMAEETGAADEFANQGIEWYNSFAYDKIETLIRPVLEAEKVGRIKGSAAAWAYYRQARLDIAYSRNHDALKHLNTALSYVTDEKNIKANCIKSLGDVHRMLDEYEQARKCYEEARPVYAQIGDRYSLAATLAYLGLTYKGLGEMETAREHLQQSVDLFEKIKSPAAATVKKWLEEL